MERFNEVTQSLQIELINVKLNIKYEWMKGKPMDVKNLFYYETKIGKIGIAEKDNKITNVFFGLYKLKDNISINETSIIKLTISQIEEYLLGKRISFDIPINPIGTKFQLSVWEQLRNIPYGETRSYKQIAQGIGNVKACRAVGLANNRNPVAILVPCHRVIGSDGKLVGYAGGLNIKKFLLDLENSYYKKS